MKVIVLAFAVLLASVSAVPQSLVKQRVTVQKDQRIVDEILASLIQDWAASIQNRGLDPYYLAYASGSWSLPVPGIVSAEGYGQDVQLVGLSQIVINGVSYNMLSGRLDLDISLPSVYGAVGSCGGTVSVLGYTIDGQGSGEINAINSRVVGSAIVRIGFSGVTVTNVDVVASMENISSDITATILGQDVSAYFNAFFNEILLSYLNEFADEINELLSYYILVYINNRLP